jgi:hypothetical protein
LLLLKLLHLGQLLYLLLDRALLLQLLDVLLLEHCCGGGRVDVLRVFDARMSDLRLLQDRRAGHNWRRMHNRRCDE